MLGNAAFWQILASIIIALLGAGWVTQWAKNRGDAGLKRQDELGAMRKEQRDDISKLEKKIEDQDLKIKAQDEAIAKNREEIFRERAKRESFEDRVLNMIEFRLSDRQAWLQLADEIRAARASGDSILGLPRVALPPSRILVVDDAVDLAQVLALALRTEGYEVSVSHNGPDALQQIGMARQLRKNFDLVLLDHDMPGMNGEQILRDLRSQELPHERARVVFLTGHTEAVSEATKSALFVSAMLIKPVEIPLLKIRIREVLAQ